MSLFINVVTTLLLWSVEVINGEKKVHDTICGGGCRSGFSINKEIAKSCGHHDW